MTDVKRSLVSVAVELFTQTHITSSTRHTRIAVVTSSPSAARPFLDVCLVAAVLTERAPLFVCETPIFSCNNPAKGTVVIRSCRKHRETSRDHIATFQMKRGVARVRASTRLNQLRPSLTQLVRKPRAPPTQREPGCDWPAGLSVLSGWDFLRPRVL